MRLTFDLDGEQYAMLALYAAGACARPEDVAEDLLVAGLNRLVLEHATPPKVATRKPRALKVKPTNGGDVPAELTDAPDPAKYPLGDVEAMIRNLLCGTYKEVGATKAAIIVNMPSVPRPLIDKAIKQQLAAGELRSEGQKRGTKYFVA